MFIIMEAMEIIPHITEVGIVLIIILTITTTLSIVPHTIQIGMEVVIITLGMEEAITLHTTLITIVLIDITTTIIATLMAEDLLGITVQYMGNHLLETRETV